MADIKQVLEKQVPQFFTTEETEEKSDIIQEIKAECLRIVEKDPCAQANAILDEIEKELKEVPECFCKDVEVEIPIPNASINVGKKIKYSIGFYQKRVDAYFDYDMSRAFGEGASINGLEWSYHYNGTHFYQIQDPRVATFFLATYKKGLKMLLNKLQTI